MFCRRIIDGVVRPDQVITEGLIKHERVFKRMTHRNELLFALATGLGAVAAIIALPTLVAKPKMLFGRSLSAMEPSLFPHITLILIVVMSCLLLPFAIRGILRTAKTVDNNAIVLPLKEKPAFKVTIFFVVLVAYGLLLKPAGFLISSFLVICTLSLLLGNRNWIQITLFAVLCPIALYLIATRGMLVSLPELNQIELFYANIINRFRG